MQGERGSRKGLPLEARADLWLFIMVLPLSQLVWPHLNAIPSTANPTQELFMSVALQFSSITTCLHANLLRSQRPHHPIYTLHCQIITLCCASFNVRCALKQRALQAAQERGGIVWLVSQAGGAAGQPPSWLMSCSSYCWWLAAVEVKGGILRLLRMDLSWSCGRGSWLHYKLPR